MSNTPNLAGAAMPVYQESFQKDLAGGAQNVMHAQAVVANPAAAPVQAQAVPAMAQPVQAQPVKAQAVQAQPVQAQPVQAQPVQAQPVQAQPVQAQPVQAQAVQAQPVMAQAVQAQPVHQPIQQQQQMQSIGVAIPHWLGPGMPFVVQVNGQNMQGTCPGPGQMIQLQVPGMAQPHRAVRDQTHTRAAMSSDDERTLDAAKLRMLAAAKLAVTAISVADTTRQRASNAAEAAERFANTPHALALRRESAEAQQAWDAALQAQRQTQAQYEAAWHQQKKGAGADAAGAGAL
jgi:hypothetical protein